MRRLSIAALVFAAFALCGFRGEAVLSSFSDASALQYPLDVSCLLSMQKVADPTGTLAEKLAHSCNDFSVASETEMKAVARACKLSHDFEGWAYRFSSSACVRSTAYAVCHVQDAKNPNEIVDTYYYLGTEPTSVPEIDKELVRKSCQKMVGTLEVILR